MQAVAGYVRVSTEKQAEENSHVRQRETIENWAENHLDDNVEIQWFADIAESGQNLERNEYEKMMGKLYEFDAVVVRELSRFGRSLQRILEDIEKLQEHNCDFISIKDEQIDTSSAQGKLFLNIIGAFNQYWADLARERQLEWIERQREEGKTIGRPKKLSDNQREHLKKIEDENDFSYAALSAIAKEKWGIEVSRDTVGRYMREMES